MEGPPRVYADFMDWLDSTYLADDSLALVNLEKFGTLRDLCAAGVRLREGLPLVLWSDSDETTDIEIDALATWTGKRWAGCVRDDFRDVPITRGPSVDEWFPCVDCGTNLAQFLRTNGLKARTRCPQCGTRVHAPIAPPGTSPE
jgi:DNA-directed RNA polymerase subunit RPC12/RpoP